MPDIVGSTEADAEQTLASVGLTFGARTPVQTNDAPPGEILSQDPLGGVPLQGVGKVDVTVSVLPPTPKPTPISYASLTSRQWALLVKAPDSYTGNGYRVWGCISQFDAATGPTEFRAQASYENEQFWYTNGTNAVFTGSADKLAPYVQNDVVAMHVIDLGSLSYESTLGGTITVPEFQVNTITRVASC